MAVLPLHLPDDKYQRLQEMARQRGTTVNRLMDEMTTLMLAEFDAETRFQLRAERGRDRQQRGLELLQRAGALEDTTP
jgi:hypothetical protein